MKKMTSIIFCMAFTIAMLSTQVFAVENNELVTFEEYSAAVEAEYAKYGLEGGVYEPEGEFYCTYSMLESDLAIVREYAERRTETASLSASGTVGNANNMNPMAMYDTVTMTDTYIYKDTSVPLIGSTCTIETTVVITVDYQNAYIVSVGTPSLEVVSGTGIADWIEYVSHSVDIDQDSDSVQLYVTCKIKKEITLGVVTSWNKEEISYFAQYNDVPC